MQTEQLPRLEAGEYPGGIWYYEPHTYLPYRYVLGRVGRHPLVCIGINPSTAQPLALASRSTLFKVGSSAPGWAVLGLMPMHTSGCLPTRPARRAGSHLKKCGASGRRQRL